jgi:CRP/FNR family cyclic AMP-dependent transcriptional regulator
MARSLSGTGAASGSQAARRSAAMNGGGPCRRSARSAMRIRRARFRARWFRPLVTVRIYGRNTTLARQGDPARLIQVIHRGWVQLAHVMPNGKSVIDLMGPGSVMGIAWSVTNGTFPYTAEALEECEVEQADAAAVLKHLHHDSGTTMDLLRYVSRQSRRLLDNFHRAMAKEPSDARLLESLSEIGSTCGVAVESGTRINLPLPVQVLADRIGCSRQWTSKLLGQLARRGAIKRNGAWITLVESAQP